MTATPNQPPPTILLATLNAKYLHASLGLRYLLANMEELRSQTRLCEFTIARPAHEIVEALLLALAPPTATKSVPLIIGFGVSIWNVQQTTAVVRQLKTARPDITIVLGGPEVSHEQDEQAIVRLADHVITGWGDISFARLCRALHQGTAPQDKFIVGERPPLEHIAFPYAEYSSEDLKHRLLYVEASRGCPFQCEFCLSALDKTAWAFPLEAFLAEMETLYQRGARNFKFVDRTFNLKTDTALRLLHFFLDKLAISRDLFVHFEVIPDHFPERLKQAVAQFPPGVLQFEVGIQSFNTEVQQRISRRQNNEKTEANLLWLVTNTNVHVHADLIFGLPGETLDSFAAGFDRLYAMNPHEIQLGMLKRLRGTPIHRHTGDYAMVYDPAPPYTLQQSGAVDSATVQRFTRLARYWDCIASSGRFRQTLPMLTQTEPANGESTSAFYAFLHLSDWLWERTGKTNGLSPEVLVDTLFDYLGTVRGLPAQTIQEALLADYVASGARGNPQRLQGLLPKRNAPQATSEGWRSHLHYHQPPNR